MSDSKKQKKNGCNSIKDWGFHVPPPERSLREFTTFAKAVWRCEGSGEDWRFSQTGRVTHPSREKRGMSGAVGN
jgi:hypothetical protein